MGLCFQCSCQCHLDNSPSIYIKDESSVHSYLTLTPCLLMAQTALGYLCTTFSSLVSFSFSCYNVSFLVFFTQCSHDNLIIYLITIIPVSADMFPKLPHIYFALSLGCPGIRWPLWQTICDGGSGDTVQQTCLRKHQEVLFCQKAVRWQVFRGIGSPLPWL